MHFLLKRITTEYNSREDRIRLLCETDDNTVCEMWITHRLSDKLILSLTSDKSGNDLKKKAINAFEQQAAMTSFKRQPPVNATEKKISWLIETIDINRTQDNVKLTFKDTNHHSASITFTITALRQWLNITFQTYKRAEWSISAWPQWIELTKTNETTSNTGNLTH